MAQSPRLGIRLRERLRGHVSTDVSLGYDEAAHDGERTGATFDADLAIVADDLERLLAGPPHEARLEGSVAVPTLSSAPLALENGTFTLMASDPARPGVRETHYRGSLTGGGSPLALAAFKLVRDDRGADSWSDLTTVFVAIHAAGDESHEFAKGVAAMPPREFMRSLRSVEVTNARSTRERLEATARFGRLCMGPMFEIYGPVPV